MKNAYLIDLFRESLPIRPYCSDDKTARLIRTREHALRHDYIQANPPAYMRWLIFDVDTDHSALAWSDANLPPPTWVATDPETGRGHISYGLVSPVTRTEAARMAPLRYLAAIESAYCERLGADRHYAGLITKNPMSPRWRVWSPANDALYDFDELADYVDLPLVKQKKTCSDVKSGVLWRNVTVFDALREWAYQAIRDYWRPGGLTAWADAVLTRAQVLNDFTRPLTPLGNSEIMAIAKSVAKWTWKHITPHGLESLIERTHRSEAQSERGRKSGEVRRSLNENKRASARLMSAQGVSTREIGARLNVNQSTVSRWLRE